MEWIIIIGLAVALYQLWRRVERVEDKLARIDAREMADAARGAAAPIAPISTPAEAPPRPEPSVPVVRRAVARVVGGPADAVSSQAEAPAPTRPRLTINFEELFGRQLPIWAGGITLAVAGFFLVVYAIDLGLLSPAVRVLLGFAFGAALVLGAFQADRFGQRIADPRVPQALAGAGIATLYACFYLAGQGYGLIGGGAAFLGLAGVTAGAVWLSYGFGLPCAVLGLIGGFAAPTLVATDGANLPLLSLYLALVSAGLTLTSGRQNRPWLGVAALVGALVWGVAILSSQDFDLTDHIFVGLYLIAVGIVVPSQLGEIPGRRWLRAGAGAFAALQMAVLVDNGGHSLLAWGLNALLAAALAVLAWNRREMREASVLAAAVSCWLLLFWPGVEAKEFALVGAVLAAIFAGFPLAHIWRGDARGADVVQLAGFAPGLTLAAMLHFGDLFGGFEPIVGLAALALAMLPALGAWKLGTEAGWRGHLLEVSAALTAVGAFAQVLHDNWGAIACAAAAVATALALPRKLAVARTFAVVAAVFAVYPLGVWAAEGIEALAGEPLYLSDLVSWQDNARYLLPAAFAFAVLALRQTGIGHRWATRAMAIAAGVAAVIATHGFYKLVFAIDGPIAFAHLGMAERTLWEALLLGVAVLAWQWGQDGWARMAVIALAATALAHFGWFTLLWHNPLWDNQAVGPVPVANLALAAYGVAVAGLLFVRRLVPERLGVATEIAIMALIPMLALTLLRQVFSGSLPMAIPMGQGEDLLRSLTGIVLAIAYLLWGARRQDRAWRIGSLVLMLLAVGKVFLVDAAGLTGLARIASFTGLGFSLIGIGWFYARLLGREAE